MKPIYIFVLLFMALPSWARQSCESFVDSVWTSEALPSGFALGFDSEIPTHQALAFVRKDPALAKKVSRFLGTMRIDKADFADFVGMSESQLQNFGIRPGVDREKKFVTPDDWNGEIWRRMIHGKIDPDRQLRFVGRSTAEYRAKNRFYAQFDSPRLIRFLSCFGMGLVCHLVPHVRDALKPLNLPVEVHSDVPDVELTYDGFSTNPMDFRNVVNKVHRIFPGAQTHFHLGIASRILSEEKVHTMLWALESIMILEAAARAEYRATDKAGFSTLVEFPGESRVPHVRGVLGVRMNRWWHPEDMHDIEFRQYMSQERAFYFVQLAIYLAQRHQRFKDFKVDFRKVNEDLDKITFNLHGALLYMGNVFVQSGRPQLSEIGQKLLMFAGEIAYLDGIIKEDLRDRLSEFLQHIEFENLITPELFLEAEI